MPFGLIFRVDFLPPLCYNRVANNAAKKAAEIRTRISDPIRSAPAFQAVSFALFLNGRICVILPIRQCSFYAIRKDGNTMKKLISLLLCLALVAALAGCGSDNKTNNTEATVTTAPTEAATPTQGGDQPADPTATPTEAPKERAKVNVAVLKGPTAIGMLKLMADDEAETSVNDYNFTVAGAADAIVPSLMNGDIKIAAVPCNLAATLWNKWSGAISIVAVNTLGVLYILDTGTSVQSVADLKGKTIYTTGAGTTPEYTLRYLLSTNGIDPDKDVNIVFLSEASEVAARLAATEEDMIAMLPMPFVISVLSQNEKARIALDVTEEWEKTNDSTVVTGVIIVTNDFLASNKETVDAFLDEYALSTAYATEHVDETAELAEHFDIFKAAVAKKAIPYCNIVCLTGSEMKTAASAYLSILFDANPASVGGMLPEDSFYYTR